MVAIGAGLIPILTKNVIDLNPITDPNERAKLTKVQIEERNAKLKINV